MSTRYTNRKYIDRGLFSKVYSAIDGSIPDQPQTVALKRVVLGSQRPPHDVHQELAIWRSIQGHPNIIPLLDVYEEGDDEDSDDGFNDRFSDRYLVFVMPFLPHNLYQVLDFHAKKPKRAFPTLMITPEADIQTTRPVPIASRKQNKLPLDDIRVITHGLASALAFLHSHGIIHRDIKPENVLFQHLKSDADNDNDKCVSLTPILIDFGISYSSSFPSPKIREPETPSSKITDVATTIYRSPELLFGIKDYGAEIDMWALGVLVSLLYSSDCTEVFINAQTQQTHPHWSDLGLLREIIEVLGTPTLTNWPEGETVESFRNMQFVESKGWKYYQIAPRAPEVVIEEIVPRLLCWSKGNRLTAAELRDHPYYQN